MRRRIVQFARPIVGDRQDGPVPDHRGADRDLPGRGRGAGGRESVIERGQASGRFRPGRMDRIGSQAVLIPLTRRASGSGLA